MSEARPRTSCEPCRKRKIKCDAGLPCSSCVLRRVEGNCHFQSDRPDTATTTHQQSTSGTPHEHPTKRRKYSVPTERSAPLPSSSDLHSIKSCLRQLQAHVENLEDQVDTPVPETEDPVERENWNRVKAVIPDKVVVEVLLEYMMQECDWLWHCRDLVKLWRMTIARGGISSSLAGVLCMSLAVPCLFLGPYQTPLYRLPIDASRLHPMLFATAQTFLTGSGGLDELELLQVLLTYSVYIGRNDLVTLILKDAMEFAIAGDWLDENSEAWRNLLGEDRNRARLVMAEIVASYRWSLLMAPDILRDVRVNLCRPSRPRNTLHSPIKLALAGSADLPLRVFRIRSEEELQLSGIYQETILDFSLFLPRVRHLTEILASDDPNSTHEALNYSNRLQEEMREWREVKLPGVRLQLPQVHEIELDSPASCHRAARALLMHSAVICIEGYITRHWLTRGREGPPLQRYLHDESLHNAQRSFDSIPVVRAMLATRHAPFVSSFIVFGLFNAATCFAIPLLRAVHVMTGRAEEQIRIMPTWPEGEPIPSLIPKPHSPPANSPPTFYPDADIKRYASNILVVLDMLSILNALPCGKLAQDRLERLVQQFDLRQTPVVGHDIYSRATMADNTATPWDSAAAGGNLGEFAGERALGVQDPVDSFPGMWDELLQLDPGIWQDLLKGVGEGNVGGL